MQSCYFAVETVETATDKTWDDDLMKGPNGEVVMSDVMKNQETTSSDMPVSTTCYFINTCYLLILIFVFWWTNVKFKVNYHLIVVSSDWKLSNWLCNVNWPVSCAVQLLSEKLYSCMWCFMSYYCMRVWDCSSNARYYKYVFIRCSHPSTRFKALAPRFRKTIVRMLAEDACMCAFFDSAVTIHT